MWQFEGTCEDGGSSYVCKCIHSAFSNSSPGFHADSRCVGWNGSCNRMTWYAGSATAMTTLVIMALANQPAAVEQVEKELLWRSGGVKGENWAGPWSLIFYNLESLPSHEKREDDSRRGWNLRQAWVSSPIRTVQPLQIQVKWHFWALAIELLITLMTHQD